MVSGIQEAFIQEKWLLVRTASIAVFLFIPVLTPSLQLHGNLDNQQTALMRKSSGLEATRRGWGWSTFEVCFPENSRYLIHLVFPWKTTCKAFFISPDLELAPRGSVGGSFSPSAFVNNI